MNKLLSKLGVIALSLCVAISANAAEDNSKLPPGEDGAKERLNTSPRHGEMIDIKVSRDAGNGARVHVPMKSYIVFPERKEKAPVVIVIHEIYGLTDWIRSVADQLAADGFIAIAPDMLTDDGPHAAGTESYPDRDSVTKAVRAIKPEDAARMLDAVREHGKTLPASNGKTATIGFCWGGARSFAYAAAQPELNAAIVYYGTSPENAEDYAKIKAPVLGLYGSDDARVNKTIDPANEAMTKAGKSYTPHIYEGAGHGFLRQQTGSNARDGANLKAAEQAWPATVKFIKEHCE